MSHIHVLQQFSSRLLPCNRCSGTQEAGAAAAQLLNTVGMTTYQMKRLSVVRHNVALLHAASPR
jgi:hypothetical protein